MSRTFIDIENAFVDINNIKSVERASNWDEKEGRIVFTIIINNPARSNLDSFLPNYTFPFYSEGLRDEILQELRQRMEDQEIEFI